MTGNELYEEYCNEYPLIMGYREVSYESWLQRQVLELRENVVNKNCNIPRVVGRSEQLTCECVGLGSTECHKFNDKWICSKCNRPLAG